MAIIQRTVAAGVTRDPDTIRFVDRLDTDLSHYFEINIDDTNNLIDFLAKIGDFRFKDADDSDNSDTFQITGDDASGGFAQKTSRITDGSVWKMTATGTISGATATATINYIDLDLDALVLNDAATQALTIKGLKLDYNGATLTAVTLSTLWGLWIDMPDPTSAEFDDFGAAYFSNTKESCAICDAAKNGIQASGIDDTRYFRCEDFDDEAAAVQLSAGLRADEWTSGGLNDAAGNVTYIQGEGGVLEMNTNGADDDSQELVWLSTTVAIDANPILEFRVSIDSVAANMSGFFVGVTETRDIQSINAIEAVADDYFVVGINSDLADPAVFRAYSEDNNGGKVTDKLTGTSMTANTWTTIRIDLTDTEQPRVWINTAGGAITPSHEISQSLITGTVQAGIFVMPVLFVQCLDATPTARTLLVDYIKIWQDRS